MKRSSTVALLTAISMFIFSGLAMAAQNDDTVVNFGYDANSQFFLWNVTSLDYQPYTGEEAEETLDLEGLLEACGLETEDPTSYGYTYDGEMIVLYGLNDEGAFDPETDEPLDLGDCGSFDGGFVAGPNGQVNHGMFMKLFNSMYDGPTRGCLVSLLARSGLGKGDHKVRPGDVEMDGEDEETATVEDGNVTFSTATTKCERGKGGEDDADEAGDDGARRGPPQHVLDKFGGNHPGKGQAGKGRGNR